jgi:tetratricopeptide (TPR) repeat protein/CTP:molybdopterin cytidylyltransferase MocA
MTVETDPDFSLDDLTADAYLVRYEGAVDYRQPMLVRGDLPWYFVGRTHEYLHLDAPYTLEPIDSLRLHHAGDGGCRSDKFERDRELLTDAVAADPGDARALFYLAQTLSALGRWEEALEFYRRRVEAGGWDEEVWYSLYQIGVARHAKGDGWPDVLAALLAAYQHRPGRLEPLYPIARHYREAESYRLGHLFARAVCEAVYPDDVLFVEREVYRYLLAFEYSICCYWVGEHAEAIRVANGLLDLPDLPPDHHDAIRRNRACSLQLRHPPLAEAERRAPPLRVVVPFYNAGAYLERCVASLRAQDCADVTLVFVDDASTDGCAAALPAAGPRVVRLLNRRRSGPLASLHRALTRADSAPADDEVVVVVHGEDWLAADDALRAVAEVYRTTDCRATYGQFRHVDGRYGHAKPFPDAGWFADPAHRDHLAPPVSFRADLYRELVERDPGLGCFKHPDGSWRRELEPALMPPLLALAGFSRVVFQDRPLVVYNRLRWQAEPAA